MAEERAGKAEPRHVVAVSITLGALSLGTLHAAIPSIQIDAVTVGLFLVAAFPWLLPYLKSAKLPGGVELEFKDFKREVKEQLEQTGQRVEQVATRVESAIQQFAISGAEGTTLDAMNKSLSAFHAYLRDIGFDVDDKPKVEIKPDLDKEGVIAYYDAAKQTIITAAKFATDVDVLFREYGHHVLIGGDAEDAAKLDLERRAVESGLADYYACSYKDDPFFGRKAAVGFNESFIHDLTRRGKLKPVTEIQQMYEVGELWGGTFWELRSLLGRTTADRLLLAAWSASKARPFVRALFDEIQRLGDPERFDKAAEILKRRGVKAD